MASTYFKRPDVKETPDRVQSFEERSNTQEMKIRKGQAYNCAIASAASLGKLDDNKFICKEFLRHLQFANFLQTTSVEDLVKSLDGIEFIGL